MRPLRTKPTFKPPTKRSFKPLITPLIALAGVALVVALGVFYYAHALPNVQLASAAVGNKTVPELERIAEAQFQKLKFRFVSPAKTVVATPAELGITLNARKTAEQAYNLRRNFFEGIQLWRLFSAPLVLDYNAERARQFLQQSFGSEFLLPKDATLQFDESIQEFRAIEGSMGKGFSLAELAAALRQQAWQPGIATINSQSLIEPERTAASVAKTADEANAIIRLTFSFLYQKKVMYVAEPHEIAAWLSFKPGYGAGELTIRYNRQAIAEFLQQKVAASLNEFYGPEGSIPAEDLTVQPAPKTLTLQAVDDLVNDIITAAIKKTDIEKELKVT